MGNFQHIMSNFQHTMGNFQHLRGNIQHIMGNFHHIQCKFQHIHGQSKLSRGKLPRIRRKFNISETNIGHERELCEPNRAENLHGQSCGPETSFGLESGSRKLTDDRNYGLSFGQGGSIFILEALLRNQAHALAKLFVAEPQSRYEVTWKLITLSCFLLHVWRRHHHYHHHQRACITKLSYRTRGARYDNFVMQALW